MKKETKTYSRLDFRFLDLEKDFNEYIETNNTTASKAVRFFIRKGLEKNESSFLFSIKDQNLLDSKLRAIDSHLLKMGVNLNQIAHYFNVHETLNENALHKDLKLTQQMMWKFQDVLEELLEKLNK